MICDSEEIAAWPEVLRKTFVWRKWQTARNIRIAGLQTEIFTRHLPNTKKFWSLDHDIIIILLLLLLLLLLLFMSNKENEIFYPLTPGGYYMYLLLTPNSRAFCSHTVFMYSIKILKTNIVHLSTEHYKICPCNASPHTHTHTLFSVRQN
jgi:hypothetical protein